MQAVEFEYVSFPSTQADTGEVYGFIHNGRLASKALIPMLHVTIGIQGFNLGILFPHMNFLSTREVIPSAA